jgi:RecB family exonuclease
VALNRSNIPINSTFDHSNLFLKGRDDKTLLAYETYATEMAIMFGADPSMAKTDTQAMVDFEIELANVRDLNDQK